QHADRMPAHFPEGGLKPGGFLEDHDRLCLAGRREVEIRETLQVRPRFRRDLLVVQRHTRVPGSSPGAPTKESRCGTAAFLFLPSHFSAEQTNKDGMAPI